MAAYPFAAGRHWAASASAQAPNAAANGAVLNPTNAGGAALAPTAAVDRPPRYDDDVSKIASDLEPLATADQIQKTRQQLKEMAVRLELSDLSVANDGTVVLHVDRDLGYRPVIKFVTEATQLMGAVPRVVVDSAPGAGRYQTTLL